MLWEIEIRPATHLPDREAARVRSQCQALGVSSIREVRAARSFLIEGDITPATVEKIATGFLVDTVVETHQTHDLSTPPPTANPKSEIPNPKSESRGLTTTPQRHEAQKSIRHDVLSVIWKESGRCNLPVFHRTPQTPHSGPGRCVVVSLW